ncbi:hypothetical protein PoB_006730300 [Plakobranchus ocellatus]|uniref:Uncharacterized protein n=1 Tax=Plakobranchus ocellatus TaxID=259542 RepID=A0AAV4D977_9GAST|nr:hypothetical protein PoB_006730300 [Plakobranchus ocellatus]
MKRALMNMKTSARLYIIERRLSSVSGDAVSADVSNDVNGEQPQALNAKGDGGSDPKPVKERVVPSQLEVLRKMAQDRDFVGFTPFLRACHVYKTFAVSKVKGGNYDLKTPQAASSFEIETNKRKNF